MEKQAIDRQSDSVEKKSCTKRDQIAGQNDIHDALHGYRRDLQGTKGGF